MSGSEDNRFKVRPLIIEQGNWSKGLRSIKDVWFDLVLDKQITWNEYDRVTKLELSEQQNELQKYNYQRFNK